jgi:plasmid stabilization system protein ParE
MTYTVIWTPTAERRLAELWMQTDRQQALTDAANQIDVWLKHVPNDVGESRPKNRRVLIELPLGVVYKVDEMDRMVFVLRVWQIRTRS